MRLNSVSFEIIFFLQILPDINKTVSACNLHSSFFIASHLTWTGKDVNSKRWKVELTDFGYTGVFITIHFSLNRSFLSTAVDAIQEHTLLLSNCHKCQGVGK